MTVMTVRGEKMEFGVSIKLIDINRWLIAFLGQYVVLLGSIIIIN